MREVVVISGKGGTGKTSVLASCAVLSGGNAVLVDCDVDAADLHLILDPVVQRKEDFRCGHEAVIRQADCIGCGACLARCRFDAVRRIEAAKLDAAYPEGVASCDDRVVGVRSCPGKARDMTDVMRKAGGNVGEYAFIIDPTACEGCGVCVTACPVKAIDFPERLAGEWYISDTRCGQMVHARLQPGGENSGKLVSKVREAARDIARTSSKELILIDGPPGVGCAVIASLSGTSLALIVTEPTLSGFHDMQRVMDLAVHFKIPLAVCINKWDLNPDITNKIEDAAAVRGAILAGRVRYSRDVTVAQIQHKAVVEIPGEAGNDMKKVWEVLCKYGVK